MRCLCGIPPVQRAGREGQSTPAHALRNISEIADARETPSLDLADPEGYGPMSSIYVTSLGARPIGIARIPSAEVCVGLDSMSSLDVPAW